MTKSINPYKPVVDKKFIIEQAENNNMSVWDFLKGFADIEDDKPIKPSSTERIIVEMVNKLKVKE